MPNPTPSELVAIVENKLKNVQTTSLDMSFNELLDMYASEEEQELIIDPEFQRLFVWSDGQQSRFIESLLLELPVPPIFVLENEDGKYSLIDGLQRFSSYLHFRGLLRAPHLDPPIAQGHNLTLVDCDIAPELNGKKYDDLPIALKIKLKRAFIRVEVVRKQSDPMLQYHMFKRLNVGGSRLTDQQIRNCTIRMLSTKFIDFISNLSQNDAFRECTKGLNAAKRSEFYDQELVLRFFAFKNFRDQYVHDIGDFLTDYMELVSSESLPFEYDMERESFEKTFEILSRSLGEKSFGATDKKSKSIKRGFSVYQFESVALGVQVHKDDLNPNDRELMAQLKAYLTSIKKDPQLIDLTTGGGKNTNKQLEYRVQFVAQKLAEYLRNGE